MNWVVREVGFGVCSVKGKQGPRGRARDNETEGVFGEGISAHVNPI